MQYASRPVDTNQQGIHQRLEQVLSNYLRSDYRKPLNPKAKRLFQELDSLQRSHNLPLILDSGCGNGKSTLTLAKNNPGHLVVGVDKSYQRLQRSGMQKPIYTHENAVLVHMDLVDFWRLCRLNNWPIQRHFLLYPNPWPKARHLRRRWHAHPVITELLKLGGQLEMRCNWDIYANEFKEAMAILCTSRCRLNEYVPRTPLTPFEKSI